MPSTRAEPTGCPGRSKLRADRSGWIPRLPRLIASGDGTVVVVSSTAGHVAYEGGGGHAAAKHGAHAVAATLRLESCGEQVRVSEIAPGMVRTEEFSLNRYRGDGEAAATVYRGVAEPLTADDVADTVAWAVTRPSHVDIDLLVARPRGRAAHHKAHRRSHDCRATGG